MTDNIETLRVCIAAYLPKDSDDARQALAALAELSADAPAQIYLFREEDCPGHVASDHDRKVCGRCGVHIDSLRPDESTYLGEWNGEGLA